MVDLMDEKIIEDGTLEFSFEFTSPDELFEELINRVKKYHPSDDITSIRKAYEIAAKCHENQFRKSGEPYIVHPLNVSIILADLELDKETICAGLLHDVVEDTNKTLEDIKEEFGDEVALLVDGVTKLESIPISSNINPGDEKLEAQAENLRKMFLAMAKDIRVILIKLADRLHNMRTLKYKTGASQQRIARETLEIYSPIAQRLGISKIKTELDDLSLKYLEPEAYYDLVSKIAVKRDAREAYIHDIVDEVAAYVKEAGIDAVVNGRIKHFFSIYKKMKNQNKTLDQIYDLFAVRIIVDSVKDCYAALGVMHEMYKPIPGRFKDYIAMPKANMYQSLHTTLIGSTGQPFEVQIRTKEMHKASEYGIAAHWKYKEASDGKKVDAAEEEKLVWLRQILEWQQDMSDNKEFLNLLKSDLDLFSDSVYCFTPTGEVKNLPAGSTPIDFAYSVHSAVGNKMIGARVNGKLVTIDYTIKNGDRIEIITSQNSKGPSRDWLNLVKSSQAKNKINQWFKREDKEDNITKGRDAIASYCKSKNIILAEIITPEYQAALCRKYGFSDWDALLAAVGHGALKEGSIVSKLCELSGYDKKNAPTDEEVLKSINETKSSAIKKNGSGKGGIVVRGMNDLSVRYSKCCSPLPGDEIVGFVTRGRGISVHRTDCVNIINLPEFDRVRLIEADWEQQDTKNEKYLAEIMIYAQDRKGFIADISKVFTEMNMSIASMNTKTSKDGRVSMQLGFEVPNTRELSSVVSKIRQIPNVIDIERNMG